MPSLADILGVAESLQAGAVQLLPNRCVAVRNRNATCRRCADACLADAISIGANTLEIDPLACVNCGACIGACPNSALVGTRPLAQDVGLALARTTALCDGVAVLACARKAAQKTGDPERFAEVPCLARVTEAALVSLAAQGGANEVLLVDGGCATCKYGAAEGAIDAAVQGASALLAAWGLTAPFGRTERFPPCAQAADERAVRGSERRRLFTRAGGYAKNMARTAAEQAIDDVLNQSKQRTLDTLRDRMLSPGGAAAPFEATRNLEVLDALCAHGEPDGRLVTTRLFGTVSIDASTCTGCDVCLLACPTGALRRSTFEQPDDPQRQYAEFQAADCTACGLCADVCLRHSVTVSPTVPTSELADVAPRLIELPKQPRGASLFRKAYEAKHS
ncbi:MAG: 4Fe-4S binding protein [Eggerthellaceae bacterium]|jgi:formate hydrogenlyase subunit 6/NADH:ubiquinone oxidoreductase subunit I|nr:4Fe-4S binding protein [Eggerthellaceae bacterium]